MRLSWYADTGVAVFSIWQGGMCTGTFRLPIGDLPRMVETLERGPGGQEPGPEPAPTEAYGDAPMDDATRAQGLDPLADDQLPDYRPGPPSYGPESSPAYHAEQPDYRAAADQYLSERPDPLAGSGPYPTRALDYPAEPESRRPGPAEYPAESPDPWAGPADYAGDSQRNGHLGGAGRPGYGETPYSDHGSGSSYPGHPPEPAYPGTPSGASYPGGHPAAPYPDPRSDVWNPGVGAEGPYPGARPEVPYPGPSDGSYPGPLPGAGPRHGASGRSGADYPEQYGAGDGDDIQQSPPPESFPYGPPPGNRGPAGRHADPDTPFD